MHLWPFGHLAVTGGGSVGECSRLSQPVAFWRTAHYNIGIRRPTYLLNHRRSYRRDNTNNRTTHTAGKRQQNKDIIYREPNIRFLHIFRMMTDQERNQDQNHLQLTSSGLETRTVVSRTWFQGQQHCLRLIAPFPLFK